MRYAFGCACVRLLSHWHTRSIVVCMRHVCDKCKCTLHTRHCEWVGLSTRFQFACALVRMQGHARMLQPSSSGVMHAYVKGRARDGTGTAVPARARLHAQNARTGMHGTGCACRCLHELLALRRSAASTRPALVVDCGIFRKLPCLQTRYIVERAADASLGARIDPAQPLASVRGVCRKPASYSMNFDLLRILEPSKKAGLRIPAHFFEKAGSRDIA